VPEILLDGNPYQEDAGKGKKVEGVDEVINPSAVDKKIKRIKNLILKAKYTVALTGAGISTASGIPDFRTPGEGLWAKMPEAIFSARDFQVNPGGLYQHGLPMFKAILTARPNPAHRMLAKLEKEGLLKTIITQNIDGLHYKAGNRNVLEIHGHLRTGACIKCGRKYPMDEIIKKLQDGHKIPSCDDCRKVIKPDVVLFGDSLPPEVYHKSLEAAQRCDLMLVLGSSLVVAPAMTLPAVALENKARLVILNKMATVYDRAAKVVVRQSLTETAAALRQEMGYYPKNT
jgi:NAD-dependent deacetylase